MKDIAIEIFKGFTIEAADRAAGVGMHFGKDDETQWRMWIEGLFCKVPLRQR